MQRKGLILAGGDGTRLAPITLGVNKQLLPVFDKPMIFYPLSTLMLTGIREIMIIIKKSDYNSFYDLLGDGSKFGISIKYGFQDQPRGIAEAFLIAREFIGMSSVALALGDNIFHGSNLITYLKEASSNHDESTIFAYLVSDPERYGVVEFDNNFRVMRIQEKPKVPKSSYAIPGLYFYNNSVIEKASKLKPSSRGELEITSINNDFIEENNLRITILGRGTAWLDTGTFESLHEASNFVKTIEHRQGLKIGCPEEIAWRQGWITNEQLKELSKPIIKSGYGKYLRKLTQDTFLEI